MYLKVYDFVHGLNLLFYRVILPWRRVILTSMNNNRRYLLYTFIWKLCIIFTRFLWSFTIEKFDTNIFIFISVRIYKSFKFVFNIIYIILDSHKMANKFVSTNIILRYEYAVHICNVKNNLEFNFKRYNLFQNV